LGINFDEKRIPWEFFGREFGISIIYEVTPTSIKKGLSAREAFFVFVYAPILITRFPE
jgi:hypothetical protein